MKDYIKQIFIFLLITSLAACVATQSNINTASGEDQDIGLGGTGIQANTGNGLGGTGITGVITGFGSIFVNGIEIEYDDKTPFTIDGKTTKYHQLEIGDVVEVLTKDNKAYTHAQIINLRHEVIGKVDSVNTENSSFIVNGQTILLTGTKQVLPQPGTSVAVNGFRVNNKIIQATRVHTSTNQQTLLRTHNELPFKQKAVRWLIQTHVQNNIATVYVDGTPHSLSLQNNEGTASKELPGIKILELYKSDSGNLRLNRAIETNNRPRGRLMPAPGLRQGIQMINPQQMLRMGR